MARVTISLEDNVDDVIDDIEDTIDDLRDVYRAHVLVMREVEALATQYVKKDAEYTGPLRQSIGMDVTNESKNKTTISVTAGGPSAPYAGIVEFGSGNRTLTRAQQAPSEPIPQRDMDEPPRGYPYEAPDIPDDENETAFQSFVSTIEDWMLEKGIEPLKDSLRESATAIAYTIINDGAHAHPYLRPAWFEKELELRKATRTAVAKATR